ncbi:hypothetical protein [Faecalibacter bovis]|uniref:DUF3139 domain-containing protein n=1 Tax=Faecalibacter bovis TaxID=2898187 RepID=A0ABX7XBF9_9FLAO|nr:hypothetical protein [Faecalibacter bovis]QTV05234.1 hypothetical protein J9309_10670 [Faecalibacter bovis]
MVKKIKNFFKLFLVGIIPIMVITFMIKDYFKAKNNLQNFQFQIHISEVYYYLNTKNFIDSTKLDLNQVYSTSDPGRLANLDKTYRFGLISNSDTIYFKIHPSYNNDFEYYLFNEKEDFLIGKYTIK